MEILSFYDCFVKEIPKLNLLNDAPKLDDKAVAAQKSKILEGMDKWGVDISTPEYSGLLNNIAWAKDLTPYRFQIYFEEDERVFNVVKLEILPTLIFANIVRYVDDTYQNLCHYPIISKLCSFLGVQNSEDNNFTTSSIWQKYFIFNFEKNTSILPGKVINLEEGLVIDEFFINYIHKDANEPYSYQEYVKHLPALVFKEFKELITQIGLCRGLGRDIIFKNDNPRWVTNDNPSTTDSFSTTDFVNFCNNLGGVYEHSFLNKLFEQHKINCQEKSRFEIGNEVFKINCTNFEQIFNYYPELKTEITAPKEQLTQREVYQQNIDNQFGKGRYKVMVNPIKPDMLVVADKNAPESQIFKAADSYIDNHDIAGKIIYLEV